MSQSARADEGGQGTSPGEQRARAGRLDHRRGGRHRCTPLTAGKRSWPAGSSDTTGRPGRRLRCSGVADPTDGLDRDPARRRDPAGLWRTQPASVALPRESAADDHVVDGGGHSAVASRPSIGRCRLVRSRRPSGAARRCEGRVVVAGGWVDGSGRWARSGPVSEYQYYEFAAVDPPLGARVLDRRIRDQAATTVQPPEATTTTT
jgi:hypothetical protein